MKIVDISFKKFSFNKSCRFDGVSINKRVSFKNLFVNTVSLNISSTSKPIKFNLSIISVIFRSFNCAMFI